jgi:multiple sugar transport system permease protein
MRRGLWAEGLLLAAILVFCVFPFYWMVTTSLKSQVVALQTPPAWTFTPTLQNYWDVLFVDRVGASLINSLIVAVSTTVLAVGLGCPAAFALARFEFRGKKELWFWFITNRFVSPVVLAFPVFLIARELGLRDTHLALILMYLTFSLPIVIWICTDQFRSIPFDLDEAASLEGASQGGSSGRSACRSRCRGSRSRRSSRSSSPGTSSSSPTSSRRTGRRRRRRWRSPSWRATTCPTARSWPPRR